MSDSVKKNSMGTIVFLFLVSFQAILWLVFEKIHHSLIQGLGGF